MHMLGMYPKTISQYYGLCSDILNLNGVRNKKKRKSTNIADGTHRSVLKRAAVHAKPGNRESQRMITVKENR